VFRLRTPYADRVSAEGAAKARHRGNARAERKLTYNFPGRPDVCAESIAVMKGFRAGVDGEWLIERVEHYIGLNGYRTSIECVQPNSAAGPASASGAAVDDEVQEATEVA
jgi:phage protein D